MLKSPTRQVYGATRGTCRLRLLCGPDHGDNRGFGPGGQRRRCLCHHRLRPEPPGGRTVHEGRCLDLAFRYSRVGTLRIYSRGYVRVRPDVGRSELEFRGLFYRGLPSRDCRVWLGRAGDGSVPRSPWPPGEVHRQRRRSGKGIGLGPGAFLRAVSRGAGLPRRAKWEAIFRRPRSPETARPRRRYALHSCGNAPGDTTDPPTSRAWRRSRGASGVPLRSPPKGSLSQ
jgi:hypothetical protein